jgi:hypothetical protein
MKCDYKNFMLGGNNRKNTILMCHSEYGIVLLKYDDQ